MTPTPEIVLSHIRLLHKVVARCNAPETKTKSVTQPELFKAIALKKTSYFSKIGNKQSLTVTPVGKLTGRHPLGDPREAEEEQIFKECLFTSGKSYENLTHASCFRPFHVGGKTAHLSVAACFPEHKEHRRCTAPHITSHSVLPRPPSEARSRRIQTIYFYKTSALERWPI